jgi:AcrR family transcriptional regulator
MDRANRRKAPLGREAWLTAAKASLINEGIGAVEIGKLARKLRVTRGGFYWFFTGRKQLHERLLQDWVKNNNAGYNAVLRGRHADGRAEFKALCDVWVNENGFDPRWDSAMREWARSSPRVAAAVRRVDDARIAIIRRIFLHMGYRDPEAFVRARTAYFHQVGYYTLDVHESRARRLKLVPLYIRILSGRNR